MPYTPTTWVAGQTLVSADNLNHMETGIAAALRNDTSVSSTTVTTSAGDTIAFFKYGKIVFVDSPNDISSLAKGKSTVASIPDGYIPVITLRPAISNDLGTTKQVQLTADGDVIYINATGSAISSASNFAWACSYICK